jgi:hypothetical protein
MDDVIVREDKLGRNGPMQRLNWRTRSVIYLLVALALFGLCVRAGHHHQPWVPWCLAGTAFLVLGATRRRPK